MDQATVRARIRTCIRTQKDKCSMKCITLARLAGVDRRTVAEWLSGDSVPSYAAFQRLKEIFHFTDTQIAGGRFRDQQEYDAFFCI